MKNKSFCLIIIILLFSSSLFAQGIFEDALNQGSDPEASQEQKNLDLNGYIKGAWFGGKTPEKNSADTKSAYAEASLKIKATKGELGDAFAEVRLKKGKEFDEDIEDISIREAYISLYAGNFDFRIGQQIIVWGRADGINPTNNITPENMLTRSSDEDDRREGNLLLKGSYSLDPCRLEAIWIPVYRQSVLPVRLLDLPAGFDFSEDGDKPDSEIKNSSFAVRLNIEMAEADGSLSYFNGYNPKPGLVLDSTTFKTSAYRMHVAGADFSTTVGSILGLRAEAAYRHPFKDHETDMSVPNPDLFYIAGADKEFGNLSIIAQYIGRYVFEFSESANALKQRNMMIASQSHRYSNAATLRLKYSMLHETLSMEINTFYSFTTEELMLVPKISYDISDAFSIYAGARIFTGPESTLYGEMSSAFVELKLSF